MGWSYHNTASTLDSAESSYVATGGSVNPSYVSDVAKGWISDSGGLLTPDAARAIHDRLQDLHNRTG